jgi:UDP-N-acetylmuramate: L-alanyl-gamma-D-glutamyl-meso-diaminopimelate ligase
MGHEKNQPQKAHFIGICGAGMSAVAKLLRDQGWEVSGSDAGFYPPVSDFLLSQNLDCRTPHDPSNIPPDVNLIVIGKHAKLTPEANSEVRAAFDLQEQGRAVIRSFPEVLHQLTEKTRNIVVAGSYGKSTTTALLSWMLQESGKDPSYFIGAIPLGFPSNSRLGQGGIFVLEGDEYPSSNWDERSKFLHLNAQTVVLTSCEYDHFNVFKTEEDYIDRYRQLIRSLPADGLLVACLDGSHVREVIKEAPCRVATYSTHPEKGADWTAGPRRFEREWTHFEILHSTGRRSESVGEFSTILLGRHNIEDILGAVGALLELGALTAEQAQSAIRNFKGLRRRLEMKTVGTTVPIYEDLSSSFPKAKACLEGVRERYPDRRIVAVFQPHTFSFRSRKALEWYPGMFADANEVVVFSPPDLHGLTPAEELSHEEILTAIREGNDCPVTAVSDKEETLRHLDSSLRPNDVAVIMTSGGMGGAIEPIVEMVQAKFPV